MFLLWFITDSSKVMGASVVVSKVTSASVVVYY